MAGKLGVLAQVRPRKADDFVGEGGSTPLPLYEMLISCGPAGIPPKGGGHYGYATVWPISPKDSGGIGAAAGGACECSKNKHSAAKVDGLMVFSSCGHEVRKAPSCNRKW